MRPLNDKEFADFKRYVKCQWLDCAFGLGLAGQGICVHWHGLWNRTRCPEYISVADYETQEEKRAQKYPDEAELPF